MADILLTVSVISFIAAGVFLVLSVLLWFTFRIPSVIGDLSGRTARKSIAKMREKNEMSGSKTYNPSEKRGTLPNTVSNRQTDKEITGKSDNSMPETDVLADNKNSSITPDQTVELEIAATELLRNTEELRSAEQMHSLHTGSSAGVKLTILDEVVITHTDERI